MINYTIFLIQQHFAGNICNTLHSFSLLCKHSLIRFSFEIFIVSHASTHNLRNVKMNPIAAATTAEEKKG